jgi:histidine triad (HIT) family protein
MAESCIFCRIVQGEIPARVVAQSDNCIAFRDLNPQAPTHVLVVPRTHTPSLNQLDDQAVGGDLLALAREVAIQEGVDQSGYRVVLNTNSHGGQTVSHLHLHVIGGRQMTWPPG